MKYVESPEVWHSEKDQKSVFLAGGITGCPDWQSEVAKVMAPSELVVLNPRRRNFPIHDLTAAEEQIRWEYEHLEKANAILFWFCEETLNPIVLFELGRWSGTSKPLFVGCHPNYARRQDVEIQIGLARPDIQVVYSLDILVDSVVGWGANGKSYMERFKQEADHAK